MSPLSPPQPPKFSLLSRSGPLWTPVSQISPSPRDLQLMRLVAMAQYIVGGLTLVVAALVVPDQDASDHPAYFVLGGVALLLAAVRYLQPGPTSLTHARASNMAGLLFIAAIVAVSRPIGATPAFYLWPILTAAYFLRRSDLAVILALFVGSFAVALWGFADNESNAQIMLPMVLVVFVVTGIVRLMRESLTVTISDLQRSASVDELTQLFNRAAFRAVCQREVDRSRRIKAPFSLVLIDLDHFKAVNDRLGHAGGDIALRRCATLITGECRGGDLPARYGGEEFVIALPDADLSEAHRFAQRLRLRIELATAGDDAPLTVSIGVALLRDSHLGIDAVIEDADTALYAAKRGGRNRVEVATAGGPADRDPRRPAPTPRG